MRTNGAACRAGQPDPWHHCQAALRARPRHSAARPQAGGQAGCGAGAAGAVGAQGATDVPLPGGVSQPRPAPPGSAGAALRPLPHARVRGSVAAGAGQGVQEAPTGVVPPCVPGLPGWQAHPVCGPVAVTFQWSPAARACRYMVRKVHCPTSAIHSGDRRSRGCSAPDPPAAALAGWIRRRCSRPTSTWGRRR
jgi:hypothetical protein